MEDLFLDKELQDEQKMYLAFGLGKAHEDIGNYKKAFSYFSKANVLKRKTFSYSTEAQTASFNRIKETFNETFVHNNSTCGNPDSTPIFILGMPRSGTSLVEQIISSHPDVYGAGELPYVYEILWELTGTTSLETICKRILENSGNIIGNLGEKYLQKVRMLSAETKHITDKMPENFIWLGMLALALPNAKIIACGRDPMDNCLSIYKNHFHGLQNYAYDLEELGNYYLLYEDTMRHWMEVFPDSVFEVSYEDLITDQEAETRKLLGHCGLEWHDDCLSFYKTSRVVTTLSAVQVRKPIYKDSMHLWKRYDNELHVLKQIFGVK